MKLLRPHVKNTPEEYNRRWLANVFSKTRTTESGCMVWTGGLSNNGYAQSGYRGTTKRLHRQVYILVKGAIPEDLDVCHSCDNRPCINPDHLWAGTRKQNMRDCSEKGRADRQWMTTCEKGHPFTPENTQITKVGWRQCITCNRTRQRIRAGWPPELAATLPPTPKGMRPLGLKWLRSSVPGENVE